MKKLIGVIFTIIGVLGLFLWWATRDYVDQSKKPVSREEAQSHCSFPLPASAHDVQYLNFSSGLQVGYFLVRFEAPAGDCEATAQAIYGKLAGKNPRYTPPNFTPASHPPRGGDSSYAPPVNWFDNDQIAKGIVAGSGYKDEPMIWIDEERGIFYYQLGD